MELFLILFIILIGYLWWTDNLPYYNSKPDPKAKFTSDMGDTTTVDIDSFDKFYAGRRNQINRARLEKARSNEYVVVFLVLSDASRKGKRSITYKDLPNNPRTHKAFSLLKNDPDEFFNKLTDLSSATPVYKEPVDLSKNDSNLGLQVVVRPEKTDQYNPRPPASSWKNVERSRGHN